MSKGINKAIILGNLGQDPQIRYGANGNAVVNVTVATSDVWNDKVSGDKQEKTTWHHIVMFGKLADIAGQYLKKGMQVYFEGKINVRDYDKDGVKTYVTEIIASEMQMLGSKADRPAGGHTAPADNSYAGDPPAKAQDDGFDDIPF